MDHLLLHTHSHTQSTLQHMHTQACVDNTKQMHTLKHGDTHKLVCTGECLSLWGSVDLHSIQVHTDTANEHAVASKSSDVYYFYLFRVR